MSKTITKLMTFFQGTKVGTDEFGNVYYKAKQKEISPSLKKEKRWVIFKGTPEASCIPPLWHSWLHANSDDIPTSSQPTRI